MQLVFIRKNNDIIPVFKSNDPNPSFAITKDSSQFKLYYLDTGFLHQSFIRITLMMLVIYITD